MALLLLSVAKATDNNIVIRVRRAGDGDVFSSLQIGIKRLGSQYCNQEWGRHH